MDHVTVQGTDAEISEALKDVNLPNLLLSMYCITGDKSWISAERAPAPIVAPEGSLFPDDSGGFSEAQAADIRLEALEILKALRDGNLVPGAAPTVDEFRSLLEYGAAEEVTDGYAAMLMEETGLADRDQDWLTVASGVADSQKAEFQVAIIGAGMSGLGMAAKLKRAGISYTILERNDQVGGTWYENRYPDCGVDTPNHFYSYSFHRNPDWSGYFSKRDE
ncbi:MAG: FAD-dependent oxidoreductase, partial [Pseudomonadales bacterium]